MKQDEVEETGRRFVSDRCPLHPPFQKLVESEGATGMCRSLALKLFHPESVMGR
jgi:hypothetical protein